MALPGLVGVTRFALPLAEVERLLSMFEVKSFATRDEQEVAGYAEVMDLVFRSYAEITLPENRIRQHVVPGRR